VCLILFSLGHHPGYPLVVAANRDESYDRPASPIAFWGNDPRIAAGRDLRAGGTWLGVTRDGRWAALTNYRRAKSWREDAPSRGHLVSDYLEGEMSPTEYLDRLAPTAADYNGFNLLLGDRSGLWYFSNRDEGRRQVDPGIHGLSNHLLDTPWPKVQMGKLALEAMAPGSPPRMTNELLAALAKREIAPDSELPDTGVGQAQERVLSPPFIAAEHYGTRMSTVLLVDEEGNVAMEEHTFGPFGQLLHTHRLNFRFDDGPRAVFLASSGRARTGT
jgi:uncharacterized protein with NRDE domain